VLAPLGLLALEPANRVRGVRVFGRVDEVDRPTVLGPSTWLPERDLIAVITRTGPTWDRKFSFYDLEVRGEPIGRFGSLDTARQGAEAKIGEPLRWEQVSGSRHEAWSHRLV
jgi:hypothetical protein